MKKFSFLLGSILLSFTAIFFLAAQGAKPTNSPTTSSSVVYASDDIVFDQIDFSMKPAWYRFFNPKPFSEASPETSSSRFAFVFEDIENTQDPIIRINLVNISNISQALTTQNGSLIMIQEALNPQGDWKPIEYWNYSWGFGEVFDEIAVQPTQSLFITAPRYKGEFNTQLRFKLKINPRGDADQIVYSQPFEGSIDLSQFHSDPNLESSQVSFLEEK